MSPSTDPHADAAEGARSDTPTLARLRACGRRLTMPTAQGDGRRLRTRRRASSRCNCTRRCGAGGDAASDNNDRPGVVYDQTRESL